MIEPLDPSAASGLIETAGKWIGGGLLASLLWWVKLSKSRTTVAEDTSKRTHMQVLEEDARDARAVKKEDEELVRTLSRKVGELEGEVLLWKGLYEDVKESVRKLEIQNARQERQIARLMNMNGTDIGVVP